MLKLVRWLNTSFWRCWKRAEFWNQQSNKHFTRWLASYSMWRWKGSHLSFCLPGGFQFSSFSSETANLQLWLDNLNPFWVLNLFLCNFFFLLTFDTEGRKQRKSARRLICDKVKWLSRSEMNYNNSNSEHLSIWYMWSIPHAAVKALTKVPWFEVECYYTRY